MLLHPRGTDGAGEGDGGGETLTASQESIDDCHFRAGILAGLGGDILVVEW